MGLCVIRRSAVKKFLRFLTIFVTSAALAAPVNFGVWKTAHGSTPQTASDNFDSYADASLLGGQGGWVNVLSTMRIDKTAGNGRFTANVSTTQTQTVYSAGTWSSNQYAEVTMSGVFTANFVGPSVRSNVSGDCYAAVAIINNVGTTVYLSVFNSGTATTVATASPTVADGDVIRLEVTGTGSATRLVVKQNGSVIIASIDPGGTYVNSGNPGIGAYANLASATTLGGTLWSASDL